MIVRDHHSSNVLVQTQGNIVLNVDREPVGTPLGLLFGRMRPYALAGIVGCAVLFMTAQDRNGPSERELVLTEQLERLHHEVSAIAGAQAQQIARLDQIGQRVDYMGRQVAALPNAVESSVRRTTDVLEGLVSDLALRPTFENRYAAASGFSSAAAVTTPRVQPAPIRFPTNENAFRRHRRQFFPRFSARLPASVESAPDDTGFRADQAAGPLSEP